MKTIAFVTILCLLPVLAHANDVSDSPGWSIEKGFDTSPIEGPADMRETDWSRWLATQMQLDPITVCEVRTLCGSRVDILTPTEAIEVEWSEKWKESIGQALLYAIESGRQPAVILLSKGNDQQHLLRCQAVCVKAGIRLYVQRVPAPEINKLEIMPLPKKLLPVPDPIGGKVIFTFHRRL